LQIDQAKEIVARKNATLAHNTMVYSSQRFQTKVIFFIAHLIVLGGFFAALVELRKAHELRAQGGQVRDNLVKGSETILASDIDVSLGYDKIALKTSINGVAIFIITIFFYLIYITFVYPITQNTSSNIPSEVPKAESTVDE